MDIAPNADAESRPARELQVVRKVRGAIYFGRGQLQHLRHSAVRRRMHFVSEFPDRARVQRPERELRADYRVADVCRAPDTASYYSDSFHGDQTGDNFEKRLKRRNCPRGCVHNQRGSLQSELGKNAKPTSDEIGNCNQFLKRQIELVNPKVVATLGKVALKALARIEPSFKLKTSIGTVQKWHGGCLFPCIIRVRW